MRNDFQNAFDAVSAPEALKARTRAFLAEARARRARGFARARLAGGFACAALGLLLFFGARMVFAPVSLISVDVNPSIELGVNRFDRVISVKSYNADADAVLEGVSLRYMNYADALETLLSGEEMRPYLCENALVSIHVIGDTEDKSQEMLRRIRACAFARADNVECGRGNRGNVEAAHGAGLSFGKYQAYLRLLALDGGVTPQDAQAMTMRQLRDRIRALQGEDAAPGGAGRGEGRRRGR